MKKGLAIVTIALFLLVIFIGEVYTCVCKIDCSSYACREGDVIHYSVSSSGTNDYCAVLIDNKGFERAKELLIYVDEGYEDRFEQAEKHQFLYHIDPWQLSKQIKLGLEMRSFTNVRICDSHDLIKYIEEKLTSDSGPSGCGILSVSYALPGEIYKGTSGDKLVSWIEKGGCLYWTGSVPGEFYISDKGELEFVENACDLFFGTQDCIEIRPSNIQPSSISNDFTESLVMKNACSEFGVNTTKIESEYIILGTIRDNFVSEILMRYGDGMLVQFSGTYGLYQIDDICQTIASGLCYKSEIDYYECGKVTRTTMQGTILSEEVNKKTLYIFIGKMYPLYGKLWDV